MNGLAELDDAGPQDAAFCTGRRHLGRLRCCTAGVVLLPPALEPEFDSGPRNVIRVADPYRAAVRLLEHFYPVEPAGEGVHPSAVVGVDVTLGSAVRVGPQAVIEDGARIGEGTEIGAGCVVGPGVSIGDDCLLHANVTLCDGTTIGDRVILHSGVVLGADGFGYVREGAKHLKVPQVGGVLIEDDVEIGANSCVDRGTLRSTRVGAGSKIDNLVQVGHNCDIGRNCSLCGLVGLAGNTVLEDGVVLGGNVGTAGHLTIGQGATVAAKSGVNSDVAAGSVGGGLPYMEVRTYRRVAGALPRLPELLRRVRRLERDSTSEDKD